MEYQKIISLLDNTLNQPTKVREKSWVEMNVTLVERRTPIVNPN